MFIYRNIKYLISLGKPLNTSERYLYYLKASLFDKFVIIASGTWSFNFNQIIWSTNSIYSKYYCGMETETHVNEDSIKIVFQTGRPIKNLKIEENIGNSLYIYENFKVKEESDKKRLENFNYSDIWL